MELKRKYKLYFQNQKPKTLFIYLFFRNVVKVSNKKVSKIIKMMQMETLKKQTFQKIESLKIQVKTEISNKRTSQIRFFLFLNSLKIHAYRPLIER